MDVPTDAEILQAVRAEVAGARAVYLFGSVAQGESRPDSDLDIAVALDGRADPVALWEAAGRIADRLHRRVDLVDLLAAPTTLQYEIVAKGRRLFAADRTVGDYELFVMSERHDLELKRRPIIDDIYRRGRVYG